MAKRIENECAFCAEEVELDECVVGKDWKVYCSQRCAEAGETMSSDLLRDSGGTCDQNLLRVGESG